MVSKRLNDQFSVDFGAYTVERLPMCCMNFNGKVDWTHLDGFGEHWPLNVESNRAVFERMRQCEDCYFFTVLRAPVEQFLSYHAMFTGP